MLPIRHSASFPSLSSAASHTTSHSPLPPLQPDTTDPHSSTTSLHPFSTFFPSSAPSSPPSTHYTFPPQPFTPPPSFALVLPRLYRCSVFGSASHSHLASLRLKSCLYMSADVLPPSVLLFFSQHRVHLQLLCSPPPPPSTLPPPSVAFPHPLSISSCPLSTTLHHSHNYPPSPPPLPALLHPALTYLLTASSHPLLLLSSTTTTTRPGEAAVLWQLVAALRAMLRWPLSAAADEWVRHAAAVVGSGRVGCGGLLRGMGEAEGWLAEEEVWVADEDKVGWWRDEEERRRRASDQQRARAQAARRAERRAHREQRRMQRADVPAAMAAEELQQLRQVSDDDRKEEEEDAVEEKRQSGAGSGEDDVEEVMERLFGSAFREQRLVTGSVVFDEHLSIVEDDDD